MIKFTLTGYATEEQINNFAELMAFIGEDKKAFFEDYFASFMKAELERVFSQIANKELEEAKALAINELELQKIEIENNLSIKKAQASESVKEAVGQSVSTEITEVQENN